MVRGSRPNVTFLPRRELHLNLQLFRLLRWQWLDCRMQTRTTSLLGITSTATHARSILRLLLRWDMLLERIVVQGGCKCLLVVSDRLELTLWRNLLNAISRVALDCSL